MMVKKKKKGVLIWKVFSNMKIYLMVWIYFQTQVLKEVLQI
jgi:hypothetical protein